MSCDSEKCNCKTGTTLENQMTLVQGNGAKYLPTCFLKLVVDPKNGPIHFYPVYSYIEYGVTIDPKDKLLELEELYEDGAVVSDELLITFDKAKYFILEDMAFILPIKTQMYIMDSKGDTIDRF